METTQRPRSRTSTEPYINFEDGHVVRRRIEPSDIEILKLFVRYRYLSALYVAALLGRSYKGISNRLRGLKEDGVNVLQLCERQRHKGSPEAIIGFLYYELAPEGYALLSEEG